MRSMETRNCSYCGADVTRPSKDFRSDRIYCGFACKGLASRKSDGRKARRLKRAPDHPLASTGGFVLLARYLLYEQIGPGTHACHWCGRPVTWRTHTRIAPGVLVADHVDGDCYHDVISNIVASCQPCNATRHNWIGDNELVIVRSGKRRRAERLTCGQCGSGFTGAPTTPTRAGSKRFCSQSCYYLSKRGPKS